jgi:SNF family Na+-dependent transporter
VRLPALSHGVTSFIWAVVLALIICFGGIAVGMSRATAVVVAAVAGCGIFLFVRIYGEDDPRRP